MQKNLVIVESPAKAKTIEKFLGKDFKVMSSFGHIRDLRKKDFGIEIENNFKPVYVVSPDKKKLVSELKSTAQKAEIIWLASDEDREGEAIAWHLSEVLNLKEDNTKRIVFHEITKEAIENAIKHPRNIDLNLVNAQQARRVLDRIVGFELSPVLWKKIKPALSAGRVQSVAVRLVVEREREIQQFNSESFYKLSLIFLVPNPDGSTAELKAEFPEKIAQKETALALLELLKTATFKVQDITTKPLRRSPAAPFTTSTLQQEAARKLRFSVAQTMRVAQSLYESGKITYMRTDSVHLSSLAINTAKAEITRLYGEDNVKIRQYQTKSKGAQEAHEAIRPAYMNVHSIDGPVPEKKLYELIWKRTIASQMADALLEKTTVTISHSNGNHLFTASGEVLSFEGFLKVYEYSDKENDSENSNSKLLPPVQLHQALNMDTAQAVQRFSQKPPRYTEATLVRKLEELGIGRPSTYAPTISTIQQREYIEKGNREGEERQYNLLELSKTRQISDKTKTEMSGVEKAKLFPTDIGMVVNDFLLESFPNIMDYQFTATVEKYFDQVAEGELEWVKLIDQFYKAFHPAVLEATAYSGQKVGSRLLGNDPKSGRPISVRIGRFGPLVQIGTAEDEEKPLFASLRKEQSMDSISLEEALALFKLPRELGSFEGKSLSIGNGRYGNYIRHGNQFVSLPEEFDPLEVSMDQAILLIKNKQEEDRKKIISSFEQDPELLVLNGRYGPYISKKGQNYKIPKKTDPATLSYEDCLELIEKQAGESTIKKGRKITRKSPPKNK
ncbi:MAG: type I DNA topoisomerase [Bacteroidales bacterium]|nr:type I DNA topoisomerase [Bacteroidales bacterium]MDD3430536.1 type I DNA topoisomerase [Bacteroidales bacterium]MDD4360814.1 type I DNA topoisomerase [Bacteroidales bacterium]MDD4429790.1 type I DNA topoisomerase [Bacteroidales bacterium]